MYISQKKALRNEQVSYEVLDGGVHYFTVPDYLKKVSIRDDIEKNIPTIPSIFFKIRKMPLSLALPVVVWAAGSIRFLFFFLAKTYQTKLKHVWLIF